MDNLYSMFSSEELSLKYTLLRFIKKKLYRLHRMPLLWQLAHLFVVAPAWLPSWDASYAFSAPIESSLLHGHMSCL